MPGVINNEAEGTDWTIVRAFFNPNDPNQWNEWVGDEGRRTDTITQGEQLNTLQGFVMDPGLLIPALVYFLGVSWVDYTNPSLPVLKRLLPAAHPQIANSFARRVEIRGWKYKDRVPAPRQQPAGAQQMPYARYNRYFLSIDFGSVDYAVLPDGTLNASGQVISEWERFVSIEPDDDTELAVVPGAFYKYKDPGVSGGPATGTPNVVQAAQFMRVIERQKLTIRVHNLPYDFLFDNYNVARKLMKAKGRVNGDGFDSAGNPAFLGFNDQTMLLLGYKLHKFPASVPNQDWTVMQFGVDVDFVFSYQEPVKALLTEPLAGWNLVPGFKGTRWEDGWFGVTTDGTSSGKSIYSSVRMLNLLTHWKINNIP